MVKIASLSVAAALFACGLSAAPAQAAPNRTWVSGMGTDSGACTRAAPCRTFAFALTQTAVGGEIDVLDPAGYGPVTITKAISIVNDGVGVAAIGASSGNAITINAGASDSVHLRGLTIGGLGSGTNGILFNSGGNLAIENCVIRNFGTAGINIAPSTSGSFSVSNTIASNSPGNGITIAPTGVAAVSGVLSKVITNNDGVGILGIGASTTGAVNVTVVDSEASNNNVTGVVAAGANAILRVAHSVVTGNVTGVNTVGGGILNSYGDNDINGNTTDNTGVLIVIPTH